MLNQKANLITYLESVDKVEIKINNIFTKYGLIHAINESTSANKFKEDNNTNDNTKSSDDGYEEVVDDLEDEIDEELSSSEQAIPDLASLDASIKKKDEFYNIKAPVEAKRTTAIDTKSNNVSQPKNTEPQQELDANKKTDESKDGIQWDKKVGYPRIVLNDVFPAHMSDRDYATVGNILTHDDVDFIKNSGDDDWKSVIRRSVLCDLNGLENPTKDLVRCFDVDKQPTGQGKAKWFPVQFINEYYQVKTSGALKDIKTTPNKFGLMQTKNRNEDISILRIPKNGRPAVYAIKVQSQGSNNPYLMIASAQNANFFYKTAV